MGDESKFKGFGKQALPFLKALGFHQDRNWFTENKALYETEVKQPLGDLVEVVSAGFEKTKVPLRGSRKTSLYRVYRDVRFSKDKTPYNTHASALITRNADKKENGFVYVHISNERSFIASGFYNLSGDELRAMRELIVREKKRFVQLIEHMATHGLELDTEGAMKRMPRGFETIDDLQLAGWIRQRNFTFIRAVDNAIITTPDLATMMVTLGEQSLEFLEFGWRAIDPLRESATT